ncbi:MAG: hypothetical protein WDO70_00555 [Alphaproteobacteria bacterium]
MRTGVLLILLLFPALLLRPAPAHAVIIPSGAELPPVCPYGPDSGTGLSLGYNMGQMGLQVASVTSSIGLALAGAQSAISGALQVSGMTIVGAAKRNLEGELTASTSSAVRQTQAQTAVNMQSKNCRIHTGNKISHTVSAYSRKVTTTLEGVEIAQFFDNNAPMRLSMAALQRLCMNGQLSPDDFGRRWFVANGCFDDPSSAHDFLKSSTILTSPVLVPPTTAQMNCLENPSDAALCPAGGPVEVWHNLNDKQRRYVGAVRYCETLEAGHSTTMEGITGGAALTPAGIAAAMGRMASLAKTETAAGVCRAELARRTGANTDDPALAADAATTGAGGVRDNASRIVATLMKDGHDMALYKAKNCAGVPLAPQNTSAGVYQKVDCTPALYASPEKTYVSSYMLERYPSQLCMSQDTNASNYVDTGSDVQKSLNVVSCATVVALWDQHEAENKKNFAASILALQGTGEDSVAPAAPVRAASYESPKGGDDLLKTVALKVGDRPPAGIPVQ